MVAILTNWLTFQCEDFKKVKEYNFKPYFDMDLLHIDENEVFVDLGSYEGDTIDDYMTTYGNNFKRIYANFYAYKEGVAFWPSQVVNYTSKTQYIYRVRKNVLDNLSELDKINEKMSVDEVLPFKNIIYLGDSETDIPSFKVVKNSGGLSICVYDKDSPKARKVAQKCFIEGRVNFFTAADYSEGSDLYNLIKDYIESIAK